MPANLLTLNSPKTELLLIGLKQQLAKISNSPLLTTHSARNLGVIFDEHLQFSDHISAVSRSCYSHIRDLRRIRSSLSLGTSRIIATSIVHSKLDYCNSLFFNLLHSQLNRLQTIQNSLARAVTRTSKFSHCTPILKSLHWLKIEERIEYKILSLTYNALTTSRPSYLTNLLSVQPHRSTRSSAVLTLLHPQSSSSLKITDRSFRFASPHLWNKLPYSLRHPIPLHPSLSSSSTCSTPSNIPATPSLLSSPPSSSTSFIS